MAPNPDSRSIELVNTTDADLNYSIRAQGGSWTDHSIQSGKSSTINCATCAGQMVEFAIDTGGTILDYQLGIGERHALFWNEERQVWDLYRMTPGQ